MCHSKLFGILRNFVTEEDIKSVKVVIDPWTHKSYKYGFSSFATKEAALKVIEKSAEENTRREPAIAELKAAIKLFENAELKTALELLEEDEKEVVLSKSEESKIDSALEKL